MCPSPSQREPSPSSRSSAAGLDQPTRAFLDRVALDLRERAVAPEAVSDALILDAIRRRLEREAAIVSALFPMSGPKPPAVEEWLRSLQDEVGKRAGAPSADQSFAVEEGEVPSAEEVEQGIEWGDLLPDMTPFYGRRVRILVQAVSP